ncbi:MAG: phosphopyruvate hydratase [Candidatus Daviesbacteria bacterium]|nr:phosphopyruvate hydratase [Candidatus Daviesbacteria bacterium]
MKIQQIQVKIINDSRGDKTLEVNLSLGGQEVFASVPSGKSKGKGEVFVLDSELALNKFAEIKPKLEEDFSSLEEFDQFLIELDGTTGKTNLGGNLILALSIAFTKAWAKLQNLQTFQLIAQISKQEIKLPLCFFNLIEGGVHAKNSVPFQEYLFIPKTNSPKQSLETVTKAIPFLSGKIKKEYGELKQGDEGGFAVPSNDPIAGLKILQEVFSLQFGLDVAASAMKQEKGYVVGEKVMSGEELLGLYKKIVNEFNVLSIEDPFAEEDWGSFTAATRELGKKVWIVGDDLTTTNVERIKLAQEKQAINAVIIKPNQIGSVTETIQAANLAKSYGWKIIVSHRSGETMDTFIADLVVGLGADAIKSGCPLQKERLVKYERLVEIEKTWHT